MIIKRVLSTIAAIMFMATMTIATADATKPCPPGQEKKGWKCVDIETPGTDGGSTVVNTNVDVDNNNRNTAFGGTAFSNSISKGGDATATGGNATIEKGAVKNTIDNANINTTNSNATSTSKVIGSGNSKSNSNSASDASSDQNQDQNQAQDTDVNVTVEDNSRTKVEDKRDHITADLLDTSAQLTDTDASTIRSKGGLLGMVPGLTLDMAKMASKNASDLRVEMAIMLDGKNSTNYIRTSNADSTLFVGYVYIFSDGPDSYLAAMDAAAALAAMKSGLTHIVRLGKVELTKHLQGDAWNIGISGGASIMQSGDDVAIAPSGGLGIGSASSSSTYLPDAVYQLYLDTSVITKRAANPAMKAYTADTYKTNR